ncbi:MAG: hypothetical protein V3S89_04915, partial [Desulfobacterales bacterium]
MDELKRVLMQRLEEIGIDPHIVPGFMRSLANCCVYESHPNIKQINERLTYMGWDGYELDYHTLSPAENCFESEGLKREGYAS